MYDAPMVVHTTTSQCMSPLTGFCIFLCWAFVVAVSWILYEKAGKRGWAVIIPFYGKYVKADIAFGNGWLFLLSYVPIARWFYGMIANCELLGKKLPSFWEHRT